MLLLKRNKQSIDLYGFLANTEGDFMVLGIQPVTILRGFDDCFRAYIPRNREAPLVTFEKLRMGVSKLFK